MRSCDEQLQRRRPDRQVRQGSDEGRTVTIAMLDEHAGSSVGALRHNGFLKGFGIKNGNKQIACVGNGGGNTADSQTAMENCIQKNENIDVVYTINEPSAVGAWTAEERRQDPERNDDRVRRRRLRRRAERQERSHRCDVAAVPAADGVARRRRSRQVRQGRQEGVRVHGHRRQPHRKKAVAGVRSKSVAYGLANCWG